MIARTHGQNTVCIDQELDLYSREPRGLRRDSFQGELREAAAIGDHLAFALKNVNVDARLIIDPGREHLRRRSRNRRIAVDDFRDNSAHRLDTEAQRSNVEQKQFAPAAREDIGLDRGAKSDYFIGVEFDVRLALE